MSVIQVPYHLDEYLPDLDVPLPADAVMTPDLPAGDVWSRLSALYADLAAAVAGEGGIVKSCGSDLDGLVVVAHLCDCGRVRA
jgi:arginase